MIIIITAGICSFITLVYFSCLMADARKLREGNRERLAGFSEDILIGKEQII